MLFDILNSMRALVQRVKEAAVAVEGKEIGRIGHGLLVLLGVHGEDGEKEINCLVEKIRNLRIFEDAEGKLNLSLEDLRAEVLIVSQFTLYADTTKGRRPSFVEAAPPHKANELYEKFVQAFRATGLKVATGRFQAMMDVALTNTGPVTIMIDTRGS